MSARLGDQRGITMIEVVLAIFVAGIVAVSTMTALASSKRSVVSSERTEVAASVAQHEFERLRGLPYEQLSIAEPADPASVDWIPDDQHESWRFDQTANPHWMRPGPKVPQKPLEPLHRTPGGAISPGPRTIDSREAAGATRSKTSFRVWTYITSLDEVCAHDVEPGDDCTTDVEPKRITLALSQPQGARYSPKNVLWFSQVVTDETKGGPTTQCASASECESGTAIGSQPFYLYDTPCTSAHNQIREPVEELPAGSGGHPTHPTSSYDANDPTKSSYCWNDNRDAAGLRYAPDLMGPGTPESPPDSDTEPWPPMFRYSTDHKLGGLAPAEWGYGPSGISIERAGGCHTTYSPDDPPHTVHSWSTTPFEQDFSVNGRMALDLYVGTFAAAVGNDPGKRGTFCVTLIDRTEVGGQHSEDQVVYGFSCPVRPWPRGKRMADSDLPDGMIGFHLSGKRVCRFNPVLGDSGTNGPNSIAWPGPDPLDGGYRVRAGHRLVIALSVCGAACGDAQPSSNDLVFFYDHARYWAKIDLTTPTPLPEP